MPLTTPRLPSRPPSFGTLSRRPSPAARRRASPSIAWDDAQVPGVADAFGPAGVSSSARTSFGPTAFARRRRRRVDVPPSLQGTLASGAIIDIEIEQTDDGTVDVVDCELIASRRELKRWRLSLTDFHALLAGGTGAIEAYRQAQRRRDEALAQAAQAAQDLTAAAVAAAPVPTAQPAAAAAQPGPPRPEPLWRRVLAWPYRALKRLVGALLRLIG